MKLSLLLSSLFLLSPVWANDFATCQDADLFPGTKSSLCAVFETSLTYQDDKSEKIELFIRKFPALKTRNGSVWLIAGGPGESGVSFYSLIDLYRTAFPNFDIFVPDHRGTGASSTICPEESFDSIGKKALVGAEWGSCFAYMFTNIDYVKAFSITHAAKDLRTMMNAVSGEGKRYLYGVSYGTQLALRLLQLDDVYLDGVILDSLVPLQDDKEFDLSKRSQVVDMVGKALLDKCIGDDKCLGQSAKRLKQQLIVLTKNGKSAKSFCNTLPDIPLSNVLGVLLDIPHLRNDIPTIIYALTKADPTSLKKAIEAVGVYYATFDKGYSNYGSSIPLVQVISASENNLRLQMTKVDVNKESLGLLFTSPLPGLIAGNRMPTYEKDAFYAKLPKKLPKTMILHGTLDPKTHYEGAQKHAEKLSIRGNVSLISITDAPHFVALNAPACFKKHIAKFIAGEPVEKTDCQDERALVKF